MIGWSDGVAGLFAKSLFPSGHRQRVQSFDIPGCTRQQILSTGLFITANQELAKAQGPLEVPKHWFHRAFPQGVNLAPLFGAQPIQHLRYGRGSGLGSLGNVKSSKAPMVSIALGNDVR